MRVSYSARRLRRRASYDSLVARRLRRRDSDSILSSLRRSDSEGAVAGWDTVSPVGEVRVSTREVISCDCDCDEERAVYNESEDKDEEEDEDQERIK